MKITTTYETIPKQVEAVLFTESNQNEVLEWVKSIDPLADFGVDESHNKVIKFWIGQIVLQSASFGYYIVYDATKQKGMQLACCTRHELESIYQPM